MQHEDSMVLLPERTLYSQNPVQTGILILLLVIIRMTIAAAITNICWVHCSKCFASVNWFCLHKNPGRRALLLSPFFRWGNWDTDMLNNLPKITQLVTGRVWIWCYIHTEGTRYTFMKWMHLTPGDVPAISVALQFHLCSLVFNHSWLFSSPETCHTVLGDSVPLHLLFLLPGMP